MFYNLDTVKSGLWAVKCPPDIYIVYGTTQA